MNNSRNRRSLEYLANSYTVFNPITGLSQRVMPRASTSDIDGISRNIKRSKNGCLVCKRRHLKCDESKPGCQRCLKAGFVCQGYSTSPQSENRITSETAPQNEQSPSKQDSRDQGSPSHQNYGIYPPLSHLYPHPSRFDPSYASSYASSTMQQNTPSGTSSPTVEDLGDRIVRSSTMTRTHSSISDKISVMHLVSSSEKSTSQAIPPPRSQSRGDLVDQYYYSLYLNHISKALVIEDPTSANLWTCLIPNLISESPTNHSLFNTVVVYSAMLRGVLLNVHYTVQDSGLAGIIELGLKIILDIYQGGIETLLLAERFFNTADSIRIFFKWKFLREVVVSVLSNSRKRRQWLYYLGRKQRSAEYEPRTESERFYIYCLRYLIDGDSSLLDLMSTLIKQDTVHQGCNLLFHLLVCDWAALQEDCSRILAQPRIDLVDLALKCIECARESKPGVEMLTELERGNLKKCLSQF